MIKKFFLTKKLFWKKIVFDNGICGKNYHRYDNLFLPYSEGMGDNGKYGNVDDVVKIYKTQYNS